MVNYTLLTPQQVVERAATEGVTDVGQLSASQRAALNSAVRKGVLVRYWHPWFGGYRCYGPAFDNSAA